MIPSFCQKRDQSIFSMGSTCNHLRMLVQLYLERQEVQELFVLHLQIPDNPGQEIISGEIVHFVWAVAEDIQELPSVQNR